MRGENRAIEPGGTQSRRPSLVGYLNIIYPNKVQIIGTEELNYLDGLDSRQRWETVEKIIAYQPTALLVTKDQTDPGRPAPGRRGIADAALDQPQARP